MTRGVGKGYAGGSGRIQRLGIEEMGGKVEGEGQDLPGSSGQLTQTTNPVASQPSNTGRFLSSAYFAGSSDDLNNDTLFGARI